MSRFYSFSVHLLFITLTAIFFPLSSVVETQETLSFLLLNKLLSGNFDNKLAQTNLLSTVNSFSAYA